MALANVTADQVVAGCAVIGLAGGAVVTIAGWFLHLKDKEQQAAMDAQKKEHDAAILAQTKEIERLAAQVNAAWAKIDALRDERGSFLTRADFERWRGEIRADNGALRLEIKGDMAQLGAQLVGELGKLAGDLRRVMETKADKVPA